MAGFTPGDRVGFQAPDRRILEGIVLRLNKKTVSVTTGDGHQWNVAPGLLRLIQSAGDTVPSKLAKRQFEQFCARKRRRRVARWRRRDVSPEADARILI